MLFLFTSQPKPSGPEVMQDAFLVRTERDHLLYALVASLIFWMLVCWPLLVSNISQTDATATQGIENYSAPTVSYASATPKLFVDRL